MKTWWRTGRLVTFFLSFHLCSCFSLIGFFLSVPCSACVSFSCGLLFCSSSLYYLCSCVCVFVCGLWSSVLCVSSVSDRLCFSWGFFVRSFVLSAFACFSPAFFFPQFVLSSFLLMCSVCFVPLMCSVRGFSLFFSFSPFVLWSSSSSSLVRPPPSSWRPFFLWLYSQRMPYVSVTYCIVGSWGVEEDEQLVWKRRRCFSVGLVTEVWRFRNQAP